MMYVPAICPGCKFVITVDKKEEEQICSGCGNPIVTKEAMALFQKKYCLRSMLERKDLNQFVMKDGVLLKYTGNAEEVVIPEDIHTIAPNCFEGNKTMKRVVFPEQLEKIGKKAFQKCETLRQVRIPDSVKEIEEGCFMWCDSLEKVKFPAGLKYIEKNAFYECRNIRKLEIPARIHKVDESAFMGCPAEIVRK